MLIRDFLQWIDSQKGGAQYVAYAEPLCREGVDDTSTLALFDLQQLMDCGVKRGHAMVMFEACKALGA